jgi:glycosyltransferase involved in cell wall biosynthesis
MNMRIGFDAKRAFENSTGLGHYSRTLIGSLATYFAKQEYYLFAPKLTDKFPTAAFKNIRLVWPTHFPYSLFRSAWRSRGITAELVRNNIDIYHGLSHEIPMGTREAGIKTVVTMHDLIFERFPHQYKPIDVWIYRRKFKHACRQADAIIAISQQTKKDLVSQYGVSEDKITVCYQSCDPLFSEIVSQPEKERIRQLYDLPERYFLSVGSLIERKNVMTICKAMLLLKDRLSIPLVIIGNGGKYKQALKKYIQENGLESQVIFLSEHAEAKRNEGFKRSTHFPAIYQMSEALLYPSTFEGFGIPVLEALCSRVPVITSNVSCMPEAGGDAAAYIHPLDAETLARKMETIALDKTVALGMAEKGWRHAQLFTPEICASHVFDVYKKLRP